MQYTLALNGGGGMYGGMNASFQIFFCVTAGFYTCYEMPTIRPEYSFKFLTRLLQFQHISTSLPTIFIMAHVGFYSFYLKWMSCTSFVTHLEPTITLTAWFSLGTNLVKQGRFFPLSF